MRLFRAIRATVLLVSAAAAISYADSVANADSAGYEGAYRPHFAACSCPGYRWGLHRHHYRWAYARYWAYAGDFEGWATTPAPEPAYYYNPLLPSPYDTAYDRAMTRHFHNPAVTGFYAADPGGPPTPPVRGWFPYRARAWGGVYQYDGLVGQYIALAQYDASLVLSAVPLPP